MLVILLLLFFSAFWGIVNHKKIWLTVLLIWILIPVINFIRILIIPADYLPSKNYDSLVIFPVLSLLLCFLGAYSSVFARSVAERSRL